MEASARPGSVAVSRGDNQTFTITPNTGYKVADVSVDGSSVGAVTSYTFTKVLVAHTISATFTIKTFTITASAGAGGSISPSGAVVLNYGASQTFTITPNTGYAIANVVMDGISLGAISSVTFNNVTANHTISATFSLINYTITASAGTGGSISPSGAVSAAYGTSKTFTITPGTGYQIADVKVDGVSVGAVSSYTFSSIAANHTIAATFSLAYVDVANFAELKTKVGQLVRLTGNSTVTFAPVAGTRTTNFFFIGEAECLGCIKVVDNKGCNVAFGNTVVNLIGTVSKTVQGEYVLTVASSINGTAGTAMHAVGMGTKAAKNDVPAPTDLVKTWGKVVVTGGTYTLDDGYGHALAVDPSGLGLPTDGATVAVTGILWVNDDGSRVLLQGICSVVDNDRIK